VRPYLAVLDECAAVLELTLPYQDAVKPRRIEIETEQPKRLSSAA
jgi:hypothetical protein